MILQNACTAKLSFYVTVPVVYCDWGWLVLVRMDWFISRMFRLLAPGCPEL